MEFSSSSSFNSFLLLFYVCFCLCLVRPPLVVATANGSSCNNTNTTRHHHKWIGPIGHRLITVDVNGSGQFRSVQDAVDAVPENNRKNVMILISPGQYIEKLVVPATKPYITFQGAGRETTFIEWHDRACDRGSNGQQLRTYQTASVTVYANYFSARNISFKHRLRSQECKGGKLWRSVFLETRHISRGVDSTVHKTLFATMPDVIISSNVILRVPSTSSSEMAVPCTKNVNYTP
ncbi:hypothetical protein V6Z11_A03G015200 [Gossypium hirsutum]